MNDSRATLTVMVPSHGLDAITRDMLKRLPGLSGGVLRVLVAGPGEDVEAPPIRSKADFRAARAYRAAMKREKVDITFSPSTSGLATMLWAGLGLKGLRHVGYRGTQAKVRRSDPTNYLALLNPRVCHVVCETSDIAEMLGARIGRGNVSVATKPFELSWVEDAVERPLTAPERKPEAFGLCFVGYSKGRPHKGLRVALEAMKLLEADMPEGGYHLTVVGDASDEDMAFAAGLPVSFVPTTPDAVRYMPTSELYLLPSFRDASPRTLREAQACGVPCVVSDIPGARDLIRPGITGVLVPPGDHMALAEAIRMLRQDKALLKSMASECRKFIADNFDPSDYARGFNNLFLSLK